MAAQNIVINFSQGIDTKTDPWQLPVGRFLSLENMVFQKGGQLAKRNGYGLLPGTPPLSSSYLTTLNSNLIAVGETVSAEISSLNEFVQSRGTLQPCSVSVSPLVRNSVNQTQCDSAVYNNVCCVVYTTQVNSVTTQYFYSVVDATTGQNIIFPASFPVLSTGTISGSSRIFIVGSLFVIISPVTISSTVFLQYFTISALNPAKVSLAQNTYPQAYVPLSSNPGWDGVVLSNNTLVLAYNTTAGGQGIHVTSLTEAQIIGNQASSLVRAFTNSAYIGAIVSVCVDASSSPEIVYISFFNGNINNYLVYVCAVYTSFGSITVQFNPTSFAVGGCVNLASGAYNNTCSIYLEVPNPLGYDPTLSANTIYLNKVTSTGSLSGGGYTLRGVGLASKVFLYNNVAYFLVAYQSTYQSTYFLVNGTTNTASFPAIVAKIAYSNGGGYLNLGLPNAQINGSVVQIPYLFKQDVEALNTLSNPTLTPSGGVYSQLGINLLTLTIGTQDVDSVEIAKNLHLSGGFLAMYDGLNSVEHNFFLFPDSVEAVFTASSTVTPTGTFLSGSNQITVSSSSGIEPGMTISDSTHASYIPAGTIVLNVTGFVVTLSQLTTHIGTGDTLSIQGNVAAQPDGSTNTGAYYFIATYEWTDAQGNILRSTPSIPFALTTTGSGAHGMNTVYVPTLKITQKSSPAVQIVLYRWSPQTQVYNQITPIASPILNDTTQDYITFYDPYSDASIVGNNILYTTGGVVPDTNAPATNIMTTFDTRLWMVDAEDPNLLWVSKSCVEAAPVEMSSDFTIFISPNIGTAGSTGGITGLAPMDDKIIIWKSDSIYYINGTGPDNLGTTTNGSPLGYYSQPTFITSVVGCNNQQSIVLGPNGLYFSSDKGIWLLSRSLECSYIGAPVEAYNSSRVTSAQVIPAKNYVVFTLDTGQMLMHDYYYNQWGVFSGTGTILSSCIYNGYHTLLTSNGTILQETPGVYLDEDNPVLMKFSTSWINIASIQGYQRFREFYFLGNYLSPHTLQVGLAYDYNPGFYHTSTIYPQNFSPSTPSGFGIPTPFGSPPTLEQWRVHTKQQLCQSFQISVQENFDPSQGVPAGAGFTMTGINCEILIKRATRPIRGADSVG